jgi:hypothetical protein
VVSGLSSGIAPGGRPPPLISRNAGGKRNQAAGQVITTAVDSFHESTPRPILQMETNLPLHFYFVLLPAISA